MSKIRVRPGAVPGLIQLLQRHPQVELEQGASDDLLEFWQGDWHRRLVSQPVDDAPFGLIELMDNNPLVCADVVRVPSPGATLSLVALGPILRAGIVAEPPAVIASFPISDTEVSEALASAGWTRGAMVTSGDVELGTVRGLNVIAAIHAPENLSELDAIYSEAYGRSFFVGRDEESEWMPRIAEGRPEALYRLRITPGSDVSLLTIQTFASMTGKIGAGQLVHTMNVMAGFEETLGVA